MAGSGENYSVPDLHCFEDLADFELGTNNHLYEDLTSTKDRSISANLNSYSNSQCEVCSSSLCTGQSGASIYLQDSSWPVWGPNGSVSYHDLWCDDSSWKFTPSSEEECSQATQSSTLTSTASFHSTVQHNDGVVEDAHHQALGGSESPQVTSEVQNVPTESVDEMSDEDIFAVNPSATPRSGPDRFDDIEDFAWWELSQMSSQSSQSSAIANNTEDSHLVPTLQTILQHHRHSAGDQVAASVDLDDTSDNEERQRNELLFNSSCAAAEQVVPNWHTEE